LPPLVVSARQKGRLGDSIGARVDGGRGTQTAHPLQITYPSDQKALIYILEPPTRGQAVGLLVSRVKKAGFYHYRSFQPGEDSRLSATDAVRQVAVSSGVVVPLQDEYTPGFNVHNIRAMFVIGLADGMGKPRLVISPARYAVPLDIRDTVAAYEQAEDIIEAVATFSPSVVTYASRLEPSELESTSVLQSLSIGDPRAENEMTTLGRYYMRTDQSERAVRGEVNLVVGRKREAEPGLPVRRHSRTPTTRTQKLSKRLLRNERSPRRVSRKAAMMSLLIRTPMPS